MTKSKIPNTLLNHFINLPVINVFSEKFPYKPFSFSEEMINNMCSEISDMELPDTILGKQAEFIFELLLKQSTKIKVLAANIQINGDTQTIGELDYIIQNLITKEIIHIELACKFYLFDDTNHAIFEGKWIGSNRKDTLLDKLIKLKEKQLPLLHNEFTAPTLNNDVFIISEIIQQYYITSSFYVPLNFDVATLPKAYQKCIVGRWVHYKDLALDDTCLYAMPSKRKWLLPPTEIAEWFSPNDIKLKISKEIQNRRAPQVYKKCAAIVERFFVVWWKE